LHPIIVPLLLQQEWRRHLLRVVALPPLPLLLQQHQRLPPAMAVRAAWMPPLLALLR